MSWRNHDNHKEETKAVKRALVAAGINAKVGHGSGTAWAWLEINIGSGQQFGEHNHVRIGEDGYEGIPSVQIRTCPRCANIDKMRTEALSVAQEVTGRHGEYGGEINVYTQDHWNQKQGQSVPIMHPNWKLVSAQP